jgi:hypothetical protein
MGSVPINFSDIKEHQYSTTTIKKIPNELKQFEVGLNPFISFVASPRLNSFYAKDKHLNRVVSLKQC